jgi:hypothetical protein
MRELLDSELSLVYGGYSDAQQQQFENAAKAAIQMAEQGILDTGIAGKIFTSLDYANLAAGMHNLQYEHLVRDYNFYMQTGDHAPRGYGQLIRAENINWNHYGDFGSRPANEAINLFFKDVLERKAFFHDSNNSGGDAGGGGGGGGTVGSPLGSSGGNGSGSWGGGGSYGTVTVWPIQS